MSSDDSRPFYHDGMRGLQEARDGRRVADALAENRLHRAFWDEDIEMIETAPCFFIASAWGEYVDCNIRSGDPGFVQVVGERTLQWPEYDGNSMYRTLGNIQKNPNIGLLFLRFDGKSRRLRISGRAEVLSHKEAGLTRPLLKGESGVIVRVEATEIYPNCPRYIPNFTEMAVNGVSELPPSPHVPREGHEPPPPEWKRRDYIRDVLPEGDPFRADVHGRPPEE